MSDVLGLYVKELNDAVVQMKQVDEMIAEQVENRRGVQENE